MNQPNTMQDAIRAVQLIMDSANAGSGRELGFMQVQDLARYIITYERASEDLYEKLMDTETMLAAYVNEYGNELYDELLKDVIVDGEVIEESETGSDDEGNGVYASEEEEVE